MIAAIKARGISTNLYYSKSSGPVSVEDSQKARFEFRDSGVNLTPVLSPRVHAKMLLRDDDHSIITSLNWLSADANNTRPHREMGVMISSTGIASYLREAFQIKRDYSIK